MSRAQVRPVAADPLRFALDMDSRARPRKHLRVISEAVAAAWPDGRLLVTLPPQVGATFLAEWTALWWLCRDPAAHVLLVTYSQPVANLRAHRLRDGLRRTGVAYGAHPVDDAPVDRLALVGGGQLSTSALGAPLDGLRPVDLVLVDSPVKSADLDDLDLDAAWAWWQNELWPLVAPLAPVVVLSQRWAVDDLPGRLLTRDVADWRLLHLAALAVRDDPRGPDPLGRQPGEPLPHPWIEDRDRPGLAEHWVDKRARSSTKDWLAQYQGMPLAEEPARG